MSLNQSPKAPSITTQKAVPIQAKKSSFFPQLKVPELHVQAIHQKVANKQEDLPEIDPQKVSLQIPSEIVAAGFNVVNRGAPVFGEIIQRTAERLVNVGASLKPLFASSFGFGGAGANLKRETGADIDSPLEQENEASSDWLVTAEAPSQFKRSPENSARSQSEQQDEANEEETEKLRNIMLAKKVIEKLIEKQVEKELLEAQNAQIKKDGGLGERVVENLDDLNNLAVIADDQLSTPSTNLSPEQSSDTVSETPQTPQSDSSAAKTNTSPYQSNLSDPQSDPSSFQLNANAKESNTPTLSSSSIVVQNEIPEFRRMPDGFQISLMGGQSNPTAGQSNPPAFRRIPDGFQSNQAVGQSNPSTFESSLPLQNSPSTFQNSASTFQSNPSDFQTLPSNNPYYHQQYRDYNPHVKRQAPHYDHYTYQPYQNMPRYRSQFGNQYTQNGYQSYAY